MHSILIPHRNRIAYLGLCIWSIKRSARICGVEDYEIVIADHGSRQIPHPSNHVRVIIDERPMPTAMAGARPLENVFNKPRLQNVAIDAARGDVLTFLDCDAIVGSAWMSGVDQLTLDPRLTRLCYRVRYLEEKWLGKLEGVDDNKRASQLAGCWRDYDAPGPGAKGNCKYPLGFEGYRLPECNRFDKVAFEPGMTLGYHEEGGWAAGEVFGNSQFSITRAALGDTRPNEAYAGRGMEDIEFNRSIFRAHGKGYVGLIRWLPESNMFHLKHPYDDRGWQNELLKRQNASRFTGRKLL